MATIFASQNLSRRSAPDFLPGARWLDEKGAPLVLAAVVAVVMLAAADLTPARGPDAPAARHLTAE